MITISNKYEIGSFLANLITNYSGRIDMLPFSYESRESVIQTAELMKPYIKLDQENTKIIKLAVNNKFEPNTAVNFHLVDHDTLVQPKESDVPIDYSLYITPYFIGYNKSIISNEDSENCLVKADVVIFVDTLKQLLKDFIFLNTNEEDYHLFLLPTFPNNIEVCMMKYIERVKNNTQSDWFSVMSRGKTCRNMLYDMIDEITKLICGQSHFDSMPPLLESTKIDFLESCKSKLGVEGVETEDLIETLLITKLSDQLNTMIMCTLESTLLEDEDNKVSKFNEYMDDTIKNSTVEDVIEGINDSIKEDCNRVYVCYNALQTTLNKQKLRKIVDEYTLDNVFIKEIKSHN